MIDRLMESETDIQLVHVLLDRLQGKTEEIEIVRQRLHRLEDEREEIRKQITAYFADDIRAKELSAAQSEHESLFGPDARDSNGQYSIPFEHQRLDEMLRERVSGPAKSLRDTAEMLRQLGGEVSADRLATELGISCEAARLRLSRTCKAGLIKRTQTGKYMSSAEEEEDIRF